MLKKISAAAVCLVACTNFALAQVAVTETAGVGLVNHGAGFVPAPTGTPLAPEDIITVKRGRVVIVYSSGCRIVVKRGRSVVVGQTSCVAAAAPVPEVVGAGLPGGGIIAGGGVIALAGIGAAIALGAQKDPIPYFPVSGTRPRKSP